MNMTAKQINQLPEAERLAAIQQLLQQQTLHANDLAKAKAETAKAEAAEKKYGLRFDKNNTPEDVVKQCDTETPVLWEDTARAIQHNPNPTELFDTIDKPEPTHLLIEGDNYHALAVLQYTHRQKIDLIYIDPPYNTGNRDFRYNDNFLDKDDGSRHTKWLAFMRRRLLLAQSLLKDTGVIFISIDDNEQAQLKLLCDSIFKEENFVGTIIWNKKNPKGDAKEISSIHEYIICYARHKESFLKLPNVLKKDKKNATAILNKAKRLVAKIGKKEIPEELKDLFKNYELEKNELARFEVKYDLNTAAIEFQNWLRKQPFSEGEKAYKYLDEQGRVFQSVSMAWPNKENAPDDYKIPLIHPVTDGVCPIPARGWRNPSKTMQDLLDKKLILFGIDESTQPRRKYLLEENLLENTPSIMEYAGSNDKLFKDMNIEFSYPKPVDVVQYLLKTIHPNPKIILDFFAGSGTTAHAVLALNKADGGTRQCIVITNNEVTDKTKKELREQGKTEAEIEALGICRAVTYPRIARVIQGYTTPKGTEIAGTGGKLRYFACKYVKRETTVHDSNEALRRHCTEMLCIAQNVFTEYFPVRATLRISHPEMYDAQDNYLGAFEIFKDYDHTMAILYEDSPSNTDALAERLNALAGQKTVYIFKMQGKAKKDAYPQLHNVRIETIPDEIATMYERYLKENPKK